MKKLKEYLEDKRIEILQNLNEIRKKINSENFREVDIISVSHLEEELQTIEDIINICVIRGRF